MLNYEFWHSEIVNIDILKFVFLKFWILFCFPRYFLVRRHMLDPYYVPLFSNIFEMLDFCILVRLSYMFRGFGKVFVDI